MKTKFFLICLIATLILPLNAIAKKGPITWDPKIIEQTIGLGDSEDLTITFRNSKSLGDAELWIVPELQPFLSLDQTSFDVQDDDYTVQLHINIPLGTQSGLYDGTIHVQVGSKTYPETFKVKLNVVDAMETIGPEGGVIEVTDPESPIFGTKLTFPGGCLDHDTMFTVTYDALLDSDDLLARPVIVDHPDIQLNKDVILTLPLREVPTEETSLILVMFDDELNTFAPTEVVVVAAAGDTLVHCPLSHLSIFSLADYFTLLATMTSICDKIGVSHVACFPITDPPFYKCQTLTVSDFPDSPDPESNCMGRCGLGCPGDGFPDCGDEFRYTRACFWHDACQRYHLSIGDPVGALLCQTIDPVALNDCFNAPICPNAIEVCGDNIDNNGNGEIDEEGCTDFQKRIWEENFESYALNTWPSPWHPDANAISNPSNNKIVIDPQNSSNKVLKMYGSLGGCWGALTYYPIAFPEDFYVALRVYNGSESLSGCHQARGGFGMRQGTSWTNPSYGFMLFHEDTTVGHAWSDILSNYQQNQWHDVKVHYERSGDQVTLNYWLDGNYLGQTTESVDLVNHLTLDHFELVIQEGTVYFDDIKIYTD